MNRLRRSFSWLLLIGWSCLATSLTAQSIPPSPDNFAATPTARTDTVASADIVDFLRTSCRLRLRPHEADKLASGGHFVWVIPQVGYSLPTGVLGQILGNVTFRRPGANLSSVVSSATYTQQQQSLLTITSTIWTPGNRWVFVGDWRLMHYPQATYGLGMYTSTERVVSMDYSYLRFYQSVLRRIRPALYAGFGYQFDDHWDIRSWDGRHDRTKISGYEYGIEGRSISSGIAMQLLYDNRSNSINPTGGQVLNLLVRTNKTALGSDTDYSSMLIDARTYLHLRAGSPNILALWSYNALTLSGNPPFLDLPSTGWDATSNLGRGYIQGRFRGKRLLYAEAEYRFQISRSGLLGGVVFANAQSVTQPLTQQFERIAPAGGVGVRIRMNKVTRANLCIDYAVGVGGSHGLFFNLGEVF